MTKQEVMLKAERNEGLTVDEIKIYQATVKPVKQVYGKYGTLKKKYIEDRGLDWTITNLPEYLHGVDRQADELYEVMYNKLSNSEQYKRTGNFMEDYRRLTEMQKVIEEEILNEIVYVD